VGRVTNAIKSTYQCLGISCADVGSFADIQACRDEELAASQTSNVLSDGAIAGIVIGCVVFYIISLAITYRVAMKNKVAHAEQPIGAGSARGRNSMDMPLGKKELDVV
jgi:hypothetical protein